jgi:hypothetical protein
VTIILNRVTHKTTHLTRHVLLSDPLEGACLALGTQSADRQLGPPGGGGGRTEYACTAYQVAARNDGSPPYIQPPPGAGDPPLSEILRRLGVVEERGLV